MLFVLAPTVLSPEAVCGSSEGKHDFEPRCVVGIVVRTGSSTINSYQVPGKQHPPVLFCCTESTTRVILYKSCRGRLSKVTQAVSPIVIMVV